MKKILKAKPERRNPRVKGNKQSSPCSSDKKSHRMLRQIWLTRRKLRCPNKNEKAPHLEPGCHLASAHGSEYCFILGNTLSDSFLLVNKIAEAALTV